MLESFLVEIENLIHRLDVQSESSLLSLEKWLQKQSLRREHFIMLFG